jgi:hypothetical protein
MENKLGQRFVLNVKGKQTGPAICVHVKGNALIDFATEGIRRLVAHRV